MFTSKDADSLSTGIELYNVALCCSVDSAPKVRHMFMKFWDFAECIYICNTGQKCKALSGV